MTEGMQTRSRAIEDQLSNLSDLIANQDAKMDAMTISVQRHSDTFEMLHKSLASQQTIMADMMNKLAKLDRVASSPPLLPLPGTTPTTLTVPSATSTPHTGRMPKLEIPLFSGDDVLGWLFQANHFFNFHNVPPDQRVTMTAFYMTGPALQWFQWMHTTDQLASWEALSRQLELRFGPSVFANHEAQLFKLKQTSTIVKYLGEFECLSSRISGLSSESLLNCFLSGLREDIQRELFLLRPPTLPEAIGLAKLVEDKCNAGRAPHPHWRPPSGRPTPTAPHSSFSGSRPAALPIKRLSPAEMAARREKGLCFNCDAKFVPGHKCNPAQFLCLMVDVLDEEPLATLEPSPEEDNDDNADNEPPANPATEPAPCISFHALTGQLVPSTLKLAGSIKGQEVVILIDGGSTNNFIQGRLAQSLGLTVVPSPHLRVTVGNGDSLGCSGVCQRVTIAVGDISFPVDLLLLPIYGADIVLGVQWLSELGPIVFDYRNMWMEFSHNGSRTRLHGLTQMGLNYITPTSLAKQVTTDHGAQFWHLAVEKPDPEHESQTCSTAPASFVSTLQALLEAFTDIFKKPTGLPPARSFDHRIPLLPNTPPVNVRPYRYPHFQKAELERLVAEMIAEGIIHPSTSPYSAPVLLVKKRDGTWRFCVDYRGLNAVTVKDRFPIPTADELFDEIAGAQVFSKLDLRAGYHQVRIHPPDMEKTAFRTHDGHYEFKVMPFGLSNAPSTFQAMMNSVFKGVLRRFVLVFFDDILVYNPDWEQHLQHLTTVFTLLRAHHLFSKRQKCEFGNQEIRYLGHRVSGKGLAVDPSKITLINDWPIPTSLRALRGFLGLTGYYRRFVRQYASIAAPLTTLLRKDAFLWTPDATTAFLKLKEAMSTTPVLQLPDFTAPFEVHTDASSTGVGAVLAQQGHPLAFFSRQLAPRMAASSTYSREMYAITEAIRKWRQYLLGRRFTVITDHQSLRAMLHQSITTPEQQRWLTKLLGFDFDIIYRPGALNGPADALSRLHDPSVHALLATSRPLSALWDALRHSYKTHPTLTSLFQAVQDTPATHPNYTIKNGILLFNGRVLIPSETALQPLLLAEYHSSPIGGHAGIQRTYTRLASTFYWPELRKAVRDYVRCCSTCQTTKPFNTAPQGLLQPLPIPGKIWDSLSMDFITHLPPSSGKTTIMVVVDRLSKHAHFSALGPHFSAPQVASTFVKDIVRLHGFPTSIVSDRDPIFVSAFWKELFRLQGTILAMSSAYHPQSDGQTEVLNRCLEEYLRSFVADEPRTWLQFLPWAEWHYNTAWHSAIRMSPYEAVFGRAPPSLLDYIADSSPIAKVDDLLLSRSALMKTLRDNLHRAQQRMRDQANAKRTDVSFNVDDWVFLRLQPHRQTTVAHRQNQKLARRFYGPFRILARIGHVAYRLALPPGARIHDVFHVSKLKRCHGEPTPQSVPLPSHFVNDRPVARPTSVLTSRTILIRGRPTTQLLIAWENQPESDATWESLPEFHHDFPDFHLEDKVFLGGTANVALGAGPDKGGTTRNEAQSRANRKKTTNIKYHDFIMG